MSIMINRVLQNKSPIIYGDGSQMRCFSFIDDCIFCLERLAFDSTIKNDIFNIGPDEEFITIKNLANLVIQETGFIGEPIYIADRPNEVKYATCDATKARTQLGYTTSTTVIDGVRSTIQYIKEKGPKPFDYSYPLEIVNEQTPKTWSEKLM
jgi:UDP-glucose 4-epimerase